MSIAVPVVAASIAAPAVAGIPAVAVSLHLSLRPLLLVRPDTVPAVAVPAVAVPTVAVLPPVIAVPTVTATSIAVPAVAGTGCAVAVPVAAPVAASAPAVVRPSLPQSLRPLLLCGYTHRSGVKSS